MFGTDHPFSISDPKKNYEALRGCGFDKEQLDAICNENAKAILDIVTPFK